MKEWRTITVNDLATLPASTCTCAASFESQVCANKFGITLDVVKWTICKGNPSLAIKLSKVQVLTFYNVREHFQCFPSIDVCVWGAHGCLFGWFVWFGWFHPIPENEEQLCTSTFEEKTWDLAGIRTRVFRLLVGCSYHWATRTLGIGAENNSTTATHRPSRISA